MKFTDIGDKGAQFKLQGVAEAQLAGYADLSGVQPGNTYNHGMLGLVKVVRTVGNSSVVIAQSDKRTYKVSTLSLLKGTGRRIREANGISGKVVEQGVAEGEVDEASLASMRDYFSQADSNTVAVDNEYGAPERKKVANVPPEIQLIINKMYRVGKITPQELDVLKRFQAKTGINVGLKIKEAGTLFASVRDE